MKFNENKVIKLVTRDFHLHLDLNSRVGNSRFLS